MEQVVNAIKKSTCPLITTHRHPDGDGLGSQCAMVLGLRKLAKDCVILNGDPTPSKFSFLEAQADVFQGSEQLSNVDLVIVLDTSDWLMMGELGEAIKKNNLPVIFVDHHPEVHPSNALTLIDEDCQSTGELVFRLLGKLGVELDKEMATAIYTAMITDASAFRFRGTTSNFHSVVSELLKFGVPTEKVFQEVFAQDSLAKAKLLGRVLTEIEVHAGGSIAILSISIKLREEYGATVEDTHSFVDYLTHLKDVKIGILFREDGKDQIKVSLRGMDVPVLELAENFGGGGHVYAAGMRVKGDLASVKETVGKAVEQYICRIDR